MDAPAAPRHLELSVSNFGPIAEGRIELRPMTVFVGPSNTGKSYLATLIYALHQFCSDYSGGSRSRHPFGRRSYVRPRLWIPLAIPALSADDIARLQKWVGKMTVSDEVGDLYIRPSDLPADIVRLVHPVISNIQHLAEVLDGEVARCFGVNDLANLVSHPADNTAKISLSGNAISALGGGRFEYNLTLAESQSSLRASIPPVMVLETSLDPYFPWHFGSEDEDGKDDWARTLLADIARAVVSNIVGPFSQPAYYLPADRAGVMHAHQVAVRGLIAGASRAFLRQDMPMPVLSGVLGDFMEQLVALAGDSPFQRRKGGEDLAAGLEQALLRGEIRVAHSQIDYPSFIYRPEGWKRDLPLMNASSMVSELAPVALYLRHVVRPGDTLIIEEPESHLHPEMQVAFLRQLAGAVKAGVRIIITTHSEWVLEELANLVLMSELPSDARHGIDGADVALSPDEFGAWFFEPGADGAGSKVREMPLDIEEGNFPSGFGLVTVDLYNRWAQISNRIEHEHNADHNSR